MSRQLKTASAACRIRELKTKLRRLKILLRKFSRCAGSSSSGVEPKFAVDRGFAKTIQIFLYAIAQHPLDVGRIVVIMCLGEIQVRQVPGIGLAKLFPRSKIFSRYHLGHLNENENNEVDVLAGAFMMIKREVLDKVGGFDETFFMYGEDVDLSYRIQKAGFKNHYFAESSIIHFKGESTRKGSMNYVRMFYNAMSIFVRKHYGGSKAGIFSFLIHVAIWFRAALSTIGSFIRKNGLPIIDAGLILLSFWLMKNIWSEYVRTDIQYENKLLWIAFPAYTIFYLITAYYAGLYDRWYKWSELFRSSVVATIVLLAAYAMLPEQYRFSRAIILFGAMLAFALISLLRLILIQSNVLNSNKDRDEHTQTIIAGSVEEFDAAKQLLKDAGLKQRVLVR